MKKVLLFVIALLIIPTIVKAEIKTQNLTEALKAEGITPTYKSYKETNDQVPIYLFRGSGCPHCYEFLEFLNSIADEYGKKFKLVSYEVYYNEDNLDLKNKVGEFLQQQSQGVPYIVIGDKAFIGYASSYDQSIKDKINELYNTKKSKRYDVMKEMNKKEMSTATKVIIANVIITVVATGIIIYFVDYKFNKLSNQMNNQSKKVNKK